MPRLQVKKKMTCEDFIKMNRGINDNQDLPVEFLIGNHSTRASVCASTFSSVCICIHRVLPWNSQPGSNLRAIVIYIALQTSLTVPK
ncbi:MAG: Sec7 domain-containing protein [Promethearchaeia archaeon]